MDVEAAARWAAEWDGRNSRDESSQQIQFDSSRLLCPSHQASSAGFLDFGSRMFLFVRARSPKEPCEEWSAAPPRVPAWKQAWYSTQFPGSGNSSTGTCCVTPVSIEG